MDGETTYSFWYSSQRTYEVWITSTDIKSSLLSDFAYADAQHGVSFRNCSKLHLVLLVCRYASVAGDISLR